MALVPQYRSYAFAEADTGAGAALLTPWGCPVPETLALIAKGGVATGYFTFAYRGQDPHVALLTTNTFDPFDRLLTSLGVEREDVGSRSFEAAEKRLRQWLDEGFPVAVWLDFWSIPFYGFEASAEMYGSYPALVYGWDEEGYWLAGRSARPQRLSSAQLSRAWGRIAKDRFRMVRVVEYHPEAVLPGLTEALRACATLFFEGPKAGLPAARFGIRAYATWARDLRAVKGPQSWAVLFPPGRKLAHGLATAWGGQWGFTGLWPGDARRSAFAEGLTALAAQGGPGGAAPAFAKAAAAWREFGARLLPSGVLLRLRANLEAQDVAVRTGNDAAARLPGLRSAYAGLLAEADSDAALVEGYQDRLGGLADALEAVGAADEAAFLALRADLR